MPRAVARPYVPFYRVLRAIATNEQEPTPLRLRACEMCLALRTGEWAFATGSKTVTKAIRKVTAADSVDAELLRLSGLLYELRQETRRIADAVETPEQRRQREINALLKRAEREREENETNTN